MSKLSASSFLRFFSQSLFNSDSFRYYFEPLVEKYFPKFSLLSAKAEIVDFSYEGAGILHVVLRPNQTWKGFKAGQFVEIKWEINGSILSRIFSISSSEEWYENKQLIRLSIQNIEGGKVTSSLHKDIRKGIHIGLSQAMGDFTNAGEKDCLLIAGGVGITPFISMLASAKNASAKYTLLYYANAKRPHIQLKELQSLASAFEHINVKFIHSNLEGRFCEQHLLEFCPDFKERNIYFCGPSAMEEHVVDIFGSLEIDPKSIKKESFTANISAAIDELPEFHTEDISIILSKSRKQLRAKGNQTILELMEGMGLQPKFGCRQGICNECACKKVSGQVYHIKDKILSGHQEEFIRICSTLPVGDITLDF